MSTRAASTVYPKTLVKTDFNRMKAYFISKCIDMRRRLVLLAVFAAVAAPSGVMVFNPLSDNTGFSGFSYILLFSVSLAGIFAVTYINAFSNFSYLLKHSRTDMSYMLPVSFKERFAVDFLSGIVPPVLSLGVSAALGQILISVFRNFPENEFINYKNILLFYSDSLWLMILGIITGLVMLYCLAVLCVALCGKMFEAAVMPVVLGIFVPAMLAASYMLMYANIREVNIAFTLFDIAMVSSPFAFIAGSVLLNDVSILGMVLPVIRVEIIIPAVLFIILTAAAAYILASRRKAEFAGVKGIIHKPVLHTVLTLIIVCITEVFFVLISSVLYNNEIYEKSIETNTFVAQYQGVGGYIVGLAVSVFIVFFLCDTVLKRGFKDTGSAFLRFLATFGGASALSALLLCAGGFGIADYVPDIDEVESVSTNYGASGYGILSLDMDRFYGDDRIYQYIFNAVYTERENISLLIDAHKNCAENDYTDYTQSTEIKYKMKNGETKTFYVYLGKNESESLLRLNYSSEFRTAVTGYMDKVMADRNIYEKFSYIFGFIYPFGGSYSTDYENFDKLYEAFKKDYLSETYETAKSGSYGVLGIYAFQITGGDRTFEKMWREGKAFPERGYSPYFSRVNGDDEKYGYFNSFTNGFPFIITSRYENLISEMQKQGLTFPDLAEQCAGDVEVFIGSELGENDFSLSDSALKLNDAIINGDDDVKEFFNSLYRVDEDLWLYNHEYRIMFKDVKTGGISIYSIPNDLNGLAEKIIEKH